MPKRMSERKIARSSFRTGLLKNFPAKMSLARKRRRCQYDADFMADVLLSVFG